MDEAKLRKRNELIKEISYKLSNKTISLYVGAGLSIPSNIPGWYSIVKECCSELKVRLSDYEDNYYKLLEYYAIVEGREKIVNKFKKYIENASNDNDILRELAKLNFNKIWTTNFDNLIYNYLTSNMITSNIINNDDKVSEILSYEGISIIKLNGDFDSTTQIITENDFLNYEANFKNIYLNFQSELYTHSFLIIGSSLTDGLYLPTLHKLYNEKEIPHKSYCFMQCPINNSQKIKRHNLYVKYLKKNYNIETIEYENFEEIPYIINKIHDISLNNSCFISGSLPQENPEKQRDLENNARILCKFISEGLMKEKIKIHTCFGMLIGNYISFPITSYCVKHGESIFKYLQSYPLDNALSSNDTKIFREKIIQKGKFFIVMGGSPSKESGVYKEFIIAKKLGKIIIPIPFLGGCGKLIYDEINSEVKKETQYPYLIGYMEALASSYPYIVSDAIISIIRSVSNNQYS